MSLYNRILVAFIALGAVSIIFLTWYSVQHAGDEALPVKEVAMDSTNKVCVVTDRVDVRDSLIRAVVRGLEAEHVMVRVYNLSDLSEIDKKEWSAIVVFQKAEQLPADHQGVHLIRQHTNGFLVTLQKGGSFVLEGSDSRTPVTLKGIQQAALEILDRVQRVMEKGK